jgi:hypothetical protein
LQGKESIDKKFGGAPTAAPDRPVIHLYVLLLKPWSERFNVRRAIGGAMEKGASR